MSMSKQILYLFCSIIILRNSSSQEPQGRLSPIEVREGEVNVQPEVLAPRSKPLAPIEIQKEDVEIETKAPEITAKAVAVVKPLSQVNRLEYDSLDDIQYIDTEGQLDPVVRGKKNIKQWDHWGKWTECSVTCGVGKSARWRHCVSPGCAEGEKEAQIKTCTMRPCP